MTGTRLPVLWICGPAGVGKSTVAWQVFSERSRAGVGVAFADADQLCMCYPPPPEDPDREQLKARNLGAMLPHYQQAGAQCIIVAGVLDPVLGLRRHLIPGADMTAVRLRADRGELARRLAARDSRGEDASELLRMAGGEAEAMDRSGIADACIETTGVPAGEVARLVRESCPSWPAVRGPRGQRNARWARRADPGPSDAGGRILLICGPTGVGKSTIGFRLYLQYLNAGLRAGFVDLDQIGFVSPEPPCDPGRHQLKALNLAAIWQNYRGAGASHLVAVGPVENNPAVQAYMGAFPAAEVTVCRLHAGPEELTRRITSRGAGGSWPQPGDPLRGKSAQYLRAVAGRAIGAARALEREDIGSVRIDTDGYTPEESAELIAAAAGR